MTGGSGLSVTERKKGAAALLLQTPSWAGPVDYWSRPAREKERKAIGPKNKGREANSHEQKQAYGPEGREE